MDSIRKQTSEHFVICEVLHSKYFKGYYDDGCLVEVCFVNEAIKATFFDSIHRANETIDDLASHDPDLVLSVAKVETVSKISLID